MQKDFHHGVTYVCARLAGFNHKDSDIIAYSSQYVDDAINKGTITFDNGSKYSRINSANKMKDYTDFEKVLDDNVLIPFHFLPGNGGLKKEAEPVGGMESKMRCTENSYIAKDMIKACFDDRSKIYALHRLGIALNVYCDTFVNKGFSGLAHNANKVNDVEVVGIKAKNISANTKNWQKGIKEFFKEKFDEKSNNLVDGIKPIGHTSVYSYPNLPYIRWSYTQDRYEQAFRRNNASDMLLATRYMYKILYTYKRELPYGSLKFKDIKMPEDEFQKIYENFINFDLEDEESRHLLWLNYINEENFDFDMDEELTYKSKGVNSWKYKAIGEVKEYESGNEIYKFSYDFFKSDWKLFHDALQAHRFDVVYDVLPRYGICVA